MHREVEAVQVNNAEAGDLLGRRMKELREMPYRDLIRFLDRPEVTEVVGESGTRYGIETEAFWDRRPGDNVRVMVSIDDSGWNAFSPMTDDFSKAPNDKFVGE